MIYRNLPTGTADRPRTIIVCGIERGGTSMAAAALHHLGVNMGEDLEATYEDNELAIAVRGYILDHSETTLRSVQQIIQAKNKRYRLWGFKMPNIFMNPEILGLFRNTTLVFVFRDIVAIAERIAGTSKREQSQVFESTCQLQMKLSDLYANTRWPSVAVSYEKALADPKSFVDAIASTLKIPITDSTRAAAVGTVRPSPAEYLAVAGPAEVIGHLEGFDCGDLVGWAVNLSDELESVCVEIRINDELIDTVEAATFRHDLWIYCRSDLNHGFRWRLPHRYYDDASHNVVITVAGSRSARIANDSIMLKVPSVFGALETFVDDTLRGWIYTQRGRTQEVLATITIDERLVCQSHANFPRTDLEPLGFIGAGGLSFAIPERWFDGANHRVSMVVEGCAEANISGSPRFLQFPKMPSI